MNTPTPSAHSGEQGKPSNVSLARYAADRIDDECIDGLRVQAGHLEVWQTFARLWTALRKHLSAMDASPSIAHELERKHEQSEPVVACAECRGSGEQSGGFCCPGCKGVGLVSEMDIAIAAGNGTLHGAIDYWQKRALRAEKAASPPSEQAGISDEVVEAAKKAFVYADPYFSPSGKSVRAMLEWYESAFPRGVGSEQQTKCAGCGELKHTPLRIDAMGGYVCLTCIDAKLCSLLGEFAHPAPEAQAEVEEPVAELEVTERQHGRFASAAPVRHGLQTDLPVGRYPLYLRPQPSASETPPAMYAAFTDRVANALRQNGWSTGGDEDFNADVESAIQCALANENLHLAAIAAQRKEGE